MDQKLLPRRVEDVFCLAEKKGKPEFLGFLSEEEAAFVANLPVFGDGFCFYGGHSSAQRVCLGVFPNGQRVKDEAFPIDAVTVTFRKNDVLSHRDFLGSLMALGIKREAVGDILVGEGRAAIFLNREISGFVVKQLTKVGRVGVDIKKGYFDQLPSIADRIEKRVTVASLRLDCVVAALTLCSRNRAADMISDGLVTVNSVICQKSTKTVLSGEKIAIRGFGKFSITDTESVTKKGRTVLVAEQYK